MRSRDARPGAGTLGALGGLRAAAEDQAKAALAEAVTAREAAAAAVTVAAARTAEAQANLTAARAERGRPIARRARDLTMMRAREDRLVGLLGEREQTLAAARQVLDAAAANQVAAAARLADAARDREVLERHQGRVAKRAAQGRERRDEAAQDDARPRKK